MCVVECVCVRVFVCSCDSLNLFVLECSRVCEFLCVIKLVRLCVLPLVFTFVCARLSVSVHFYAVFLPAAGN